MTLTGLPHSEISGCGCQHLPGAYRSVATSFIGSRRQGIHPAPLSVCALCWVQRLRSAVLRLGPERCAMFKQHTKRTWRCDGPPPARSGPTTLVSLFYVDYRMWLVRCRRLRASGVTASRRLQLQARSGGQSR